MVEEELSPRTLLVTSLNTACGVRASKIQLAGGTRVTRACDKEAITIRPSSRKERASAEITFWAESSKENRLWPG